MMRSGRKERLREKRKQDEGCKKWKKKKLGSLT
jgi:hypothetical protein